MRALGLLVALLLTTGCTTTLSLTVAKVAENRPPRAVAIGTRTLAVGTRVTIDLGVVFADPDGDALAFRAVADDPAIVAVTVDGSTLQVTGLAAGETRAVVTAQEARGHATTATVTLTVTP